MKTYTARASEIERKWYIVDATDQSVGRIASQIANILRGKNKPTFTPHLDTGDFVVVVNAEKVKLTGAKENEKTYWRYTQFPGGERAVVAKQMRATYPDRMVTIAVRGMLPKGPLGRQMLKKLKVYGGDTHPHTAQKPEALKL